jgi:hypothetical protein
MKGSQDIERTSSGLPTDRQVQSNMPLFFEGGHKNMMLIKIHLWKPSEKQSQTFVKHTFRRCLYKYNG